MSSSKNENLFEDRYLIIEELGTGGMGKVFRARQTDADREVALKFLLNEKIDSQESIARFHREFKLLSKLSHPHIMTVYGLALDKQGNPYAICELLQGETLSVLLRREGKLSWQRALGITLQIGQAMQYTHELGILHRDLKPDNVMLMDCPEPDFVKLLDFGLSRVLVDDDSETPKVTWTGKAIGTASYSSPEQALKKADKRSDIYSLGCILFELLAGECLFAADSPAAAIYRHCMEDPTDRFQMISSKVPCMLLALLSSMLSEDPEQRIQSMKEVTNSLELILDKPGRLVEGKNCCPQSNSMRQIMLVAGILLSLTMGGVFLLWKQDKSRIHVDDLDGASQEKQRLDDRYDHLYKRLETSYGTDDPRLEEPLGKLAELYRLQNKCEQAESLLKRVLAIREKALGPNNLDVASSLDELGRLYNRQCKYAEAEPLFKRSLAIREKVLGPNAPNIASSLDGLASSYEIQGKAAEAEPLRKRSLAVREAALGLNHEDVELSENLLALCYDRQGKFAKAEAMYKRALAIREKLLGPDHEDVISLNHLADCYEHQSKHAEAEALYKHALATPKKLLEPDQDSIVFSLFGLGELYAHQGRAAL